jgi:hypothetical protein
MPHSSSRTTRAKRASGGEEGPDARLPAKKSRTSRTTDASDREIEALIAKLKVFKEDEFADLAAPVPQRHSQPRAPGPAAAFDENRQGAFREDW